MGPGIQHDDAGEREVRAARNEALFRSLNEKIVELERAYVVASDTFTIACECADASCVEMLEIAPQAYERIRANPRQFAVLPGHVYVEVEAVVAHESEYVIVEKTAANAALVAEETAAEQT